MANRKPIVVVSGEMQVVQSGDVVDPATLGAGTANSTTVLKGNSTYGQINPSNIIGGLLARIAAYG